VRGVWRLFVSGLSQGVPPVPGGPGSMIR
jgi:hypothetical protein